MTMITPSYLGETIEYSSLHACRSTLEDPTGWNLRPWKHFSHEQRPIIREVCERLHCPVKVFYWAFFFSSQVRCSQAGD